MMLVAENSPNQAMPVTSIVWTAILGAALTAVFVYTVGSLGRGGATPLKLALAGTAMIVLYVQGIDARATKDQELDEVLVATETIENGETVAAAQEAGKFGKTEVRRADLVDGSHQHKH